MKTLSLPRSLFTLVAASFLAAASASGQLLEFRFNDSGTTTANTGSSADTGAFWTGTSAAPVATDLHGVAGSGVSGLAGDLAFDNTGASWQGSGTGRLKLASSTALNSLTSFTLSGWYQTSETGSWSGARLFSKNGTNNTVELDFSSGSAGGNAALRLAIRTPTYSGTAATSSVSSELALSGEWIFFAVTYDGTLTEDNVRFYYGSVTTGVTLLSVATLDAGTLSGSSLDFNIGNNVSNRPWVGYLDNLRVFGVTSGGGGALGSAQLESWRQVDVIPEASANLLLTTGLAMLLLGSHFRRQKKEVTAG